MRFYEFLIQASQFEDIELHKKYKFCSNLQSWLKKDQPGEGFSLKDQIVANNFNNDIQGVYKKPNLVAAPFVNLPTAETQLSEDEEKKLSVIIEEINNRTGNHFDKDVAAQAMLQIKEILLKSQKLQQSALVNSEDEFKFSYFDDIDDALVQGLEQNQDFFSMLLSNPEIKKQVLGVFVTEVYKTLKNKDVSKNNVIKLNPEVKVQDTYLMAAEPINVSKLTEDERIGILHECILGLQNVGFSAKTKVFTKQCHWIAIYRIAADYGLAIDGDFKYFNQKVSEMEITGLPNLPNNYLENHIKNRYSRSFEDWTSDGLDGKELQEYNDIRNCAVKFESIVKRNLHQD